MSRPMPPTVEVQLKPEPSVGERRRLVILMYGGYCLFGVAVTAGLNDDNYRGAGLGGVILSFIAMAYGFFRLTGPIFAGGPVVGNRLAEARQQARLNQALRRAMPVLLLGATLYLGLAATAIPFFR